MFQGDPYLTFNIALGLEAWGFSFLFAPIRLLGTIIFPLCYGALGAYSYHLTLIWYPLFILPISLTPPYFIKELPFCVHTEMLLAPIHEVQKCNMCLTSPNMMSSNSLHFAANDMISLIFIKDLFILLESQRYRKRDRQTQKFFPLDCCNNQSWAGLKLQPRSFF